MGLTRSINPMNDTALRACIIFFSLSIVACPCRAASSHPVVPPANMSAPAKTVEKKKLQPGEAETRVHPAPAEAASVAVVSVVAVVVPPQKRRERASGQEEGTCMCMYVCCGV